MKFIPLILAVIILTACAPDPRSYAEAEAIRTRAVDASRAENIQIAQTERMNGIAYNERASVSSNVSAAMTVIVWVLCLGAAAIILSGSAGVSIAAVQIGRATGQAAFIAARQVRLDRVTRQYPAIVSQDGNYVTDLNAGQVIQLDAPRMADEKLLPGVSHVRTIGAMSNHKQAQLSAEVTTNE